LSEHVTTAQAAQIKLLHELGWKYRAIATKVNVTYRQVSQTLMSELWTDPEVFSRVRASRPSGRRGRKPLLDTPKRNKLVQWLRADPLHRRLPWEQIPYTLDLGVEYGIHALTTAMHTEGFYRRRARKRPIRTRTTQKKRLQFALDHERWTVKDWMQILWSDEV
jgi:transposase